MSDADFRNMSATIEQYIETLFSCVESPEDLHEELSAFAYKLRHPEAKIRKVFINYLQPNHKGISIPMNFTHGLAKMFPSNTAMEVYGANEKYDPEVSYCLSLIKGSSFACFNDPKSEHVPYIIKLATQTTQERGIEYKGIVVVNTNKQAIIDRIPESMRVVVKFRSRFTPEQASVFRMMFVESDGGINVAEFLPAYLREIYENPNCPDLERWQP